MNAHTPGPWRYVPQNGSPTTGQHMIAGGLPGYLAEVRDCGSGDVEANARLIAAAPDLLAALQLALRALENARLEYDYHGNPMDKSDADIIAAVDALRETIAKATGEAL